MRAFALIRHYQVLHFAICLICVVNMAYLLNSVKGAVFVDEVEVLLQEPPPLIENVVAEESIIKIRKKPNIRRRKAIERTAMRVVKKYLLKQGYAEEKIIDVSAQESWDYQVTKDDKTLYIEVKGLSSRGNTLTIGLTHREYSFIKKTRGNYWLAIVRNCPKKPELFVFEDLKRRGRKTWKAKCRGQKVRLNVTPEIAARFTCNVSNISALAKR